MKIFHTLLATAGDVAADGLASINCGAAKGPAEHEGAVG